MKNKISLNFKAFVNIRITHFLIKNLNFINENEKFKFLIFISKD